MKTLLSLSLALLTGCCTPYPPQGCAYPPMCSGQSIVNNTGYLLDVFQDGVLIAKNMGIGQVLPLRAMFFQRTTVVVVTAHDGSGDYVGSDQYIFNSTVAEAWNVSRVYRPKRS